MLNDGRPCGRPFFMVYMVIVCRVIFVNVKFIYIFVAM